MTRSERIVRYTADEMEEMVRRGEDQTDWAAIDAKTDADIAADIDPEDEGEIDWSTLRVGHTSGKQQLTLRVDTDIVDWFRTDGAGYQTRMNAVLRGYVDAQKRRSS